MLCPWPLKAMGFLRWVGWRAAAVKAKHSRIASSFASPCVPFVQAAQPQAAPPQAAPTPVSISRVEAQGRRVAEQRDTGGVIRAPRKRAVIGCNLTYMSLRPIMPLVSALCK